MSLSKNTQSLFTLSLHAVSNDILAKWKESYFNNNYDTFSKELQNKLNTNFPYSIYDQLFDHLIKTHAQVIQIDLGSDSTPKITRLINILLIKHLNRLNLNILSCIGSASEEELNHLERILIAQIPNMTSLTEISLQTCKIDSTLPICNNEIMEKIGSSCPQLRTLDISYNNKVTDVGLKHLLPNDNDKGCPDLSKVSLFGCSVSVEGVADFICGLPRLKYLGFRETGQSLMILNTSLNYSKSEKQFELAHVNNLGFSSHTLKESRKLRCDGKMINAISTLCPKLTGLKIRVSDCDLKYLHQLHNVCVLELVFNIVKPANPGRETVNYLKHNGKQLISLSFVCHTFSTQYLKVVGENCTNLKRLLIRCNKFNCEEITSDKNKCSLLNLEVFSFRVGGTDSGICMIPHNIINYALHKSNCLTEIVLTMKNSWFSDSYINEIFSSINTSMIKQIMIQVPFNNHTPSNKLSMMSVRTIISKCPQLRELGNLLVWDVSLEEVEELRRELTCSNSALILVYKMIYS